MGKIKLFIMLLIFLFISFLYPINILLYIVDIKLACTVLFSFFHANVKDKVSVKKTRFLPSWSFNLVITETIIRHV